MALTKTIKLDELCTSVMNIDRNIRSAILVDKNGNLLHKTVRRGFLQPSVERWNDIRFMECALEISIGTKYDRLYGPIRYHHSDRNNFIIFSFPFHKNVLLVTSTKNISPISLATNISYFINYKMTKL
jgi:hypothetical protein